MGVQNSKTLVENHYEHKILENIGENFNLVKEVQDSRYGLIRVMERSERGKEFTLDPADQTEHIMSITELLTDTLKYTELFHDVQKSVRRKHPNLLRFLGYEFQLQSEICGVSNRCTMYYEYYDQELGQEIQRRRKRNDYFNQSELWYLLETGASLLRYLQENEISHGNIKPESLMLTPSGVVKIADESLINSQGNSYIKAFLGIQKGFVAPELLIHMKNQEKYPEFDKFRADVYSLGCTILEAATLQSVERIYNWDALEIEEELLQEMMQKVASMYSNQFVGILSLLLNSRVSDRPDFISLHYDILEQRQNNTGGKRNQGNRAQQQHAQAQNNRQAPQNYPQMPTAKPEIVYVNQQAQRQNQQMENGVANTNNINGNMVQQSQGYSRQPPAPQNFPPNAQFSSVNGAYQVVGKNPNQREVVTMNSAQVSQPMPTQVQPAIPNNQAVTYNQQPYMKPQSPQKFNVANNNNNMKGMSPMPFMVEEVNMYGQYGAQKEIEQSVQVINQQPRVVTQPPTQPVYQQTVTQVAPQQPPMNQNNFQYMQPFYPPPPPPSQQIMKQPEMVDQNSAPYYHQGQNNVQSVQQVTVKTSISDFNSQKYFMPPDAQHFATQNRQVIQEPLQPITQNYSYANNGNHMVDSPIKQQAIQQIFNTDLDDRVSKALKLTQETIRRNEKVPNLVNGSPVQDYTVNGNRMSVGNGQWTDNAYYPLR